MKFLRVLTLFFAACCGMTLAQVYTAPSQPTQSQSSRSVPSDTTAPAPQKQSQSPFGQEVPLLDPSTETVKFNGQTWAITDNRLFGARFEKYLNEPETTAKEAKEYEATIAKILSTISPLALGGPSISKGVRLLPRASSFEMDAKLCDSLLNVIYVAVASKKNTGAANDALQALEEEKARILKNMGVVEAKTVLKSEPTSVTRSGRSGSSTTTRKASVIPGEGTAEYLNYQKRVTEIEVLKKKHEADSTLNSLEAKIQYQTLIAQFLVQRRFEHALIACRFYTMVFSEGNQKIAFKKGSDIEKLFSTSVGMSPTIGSMEAIANEAIRDTDKAIEAFDYLLGRGELVSATKRLSEAFAVGEFLPPIRTLPREKKQKVQDFARESYKLIGILDVKDYATARVCVDKLKKIASDFDSSKADAAIATFTRISDMHITNARAQLLAGNSAEAQVEIKKAMEVWPQNPKLEEFDKALNLSTEIVKARLDFERLLKEENYRQIFKDQYRFAPAIQGEARLEDAFQQIIKNIAEIEKALAKAREFSRMGQNYASWEELKKMRDIKLYSQDPELGRAIEDLSPRVSDLTKALDVAEHAEQTEETGTALAWYFKARDIYPSSIFAQEGIARIVKRLLPDSENSGQNTPPD